MEIANSLSGRLAGIMEELKESGITPCLLKELEEIRHEIAEQEAVIMRAGEGLDELIKTERKKRSKFDA